MNIWSSVFLPYLLGYRQRCWLWTPGFPLRREARGSTGGRQPRTQHPTSAAGSHPLTFPARDRAPSLGKRRRDEGEAAGREKMLVPSWGETGKLLCSSPTNTNFTPSMSPSGIPSGTSALQWV